MSLIIGRGLRLACPVALLFAFNLVLTGQQCPRDGFDINQLEKQASQASDADTIYRLSAIAEHALIPALRRLAVPGMRVDSVPGAAQVSLARLGDQSAIQQLQHELNETNLRNSAIEKLIRAGSDRTISILMTYLIEHLSDDALYRDLGDASTDVRHQITSELSRQLQVGPIAKNGNFSVSLEDWVAWWKEKKDKPITVSISNILNGAHLKCLARKVEWGFPNAVLDLANSGDPQVIPILQKLTKIGDASVATFSLGTLRGNATVGLAKLGDSEAFQAIVADLNGIGYESAIQELQLIGGARAVGALIAALGNSGARPEHNTHRGTKSRAEYLKNRDVQILRALSSMVANPPSAKGQATPKQWKEWWVKNKDSLKFRQTLPQTYE